jgi:hypothetical protein
MGCQAWINYSYPRNEVSVVFKELLKILYYGTMFVFTILLMQFVIVYTVAHVLELVP